MSDSFFRIRNGLTLGNLSADPASGVNGDMYYNTVSNTIREFVNGIWTDAVDTSNIQVLANKTLPFLRTNVTTDSTTTGTAATLIPADITAGIVHLTNVSLVSIGGIPAGVAGQFLTIDNKTGNKIVINNEDAGVTPANRIITGTGNFISLLANASITLVYDASSSRWRVVGGTGSSGNAGGVAIISGTTSLVVTLPNTMTSTSYSVLAQLTNTVDVNPMFQPITITNKTTSSFTATWNAPIENSNYILEYITSGDL